MKYLLADQYPGFHYASMTLFVPHLNVKKMFLVSVQTVSVLQSSTPDIYYIGGNQYL